jgi:hypothetical protein
MGADRSRDATGEGVIRVTIAACIPLLVGCGYGGPGPAERVQVADLVGRWVGAGCIVGDYRKQVELVLEANGAYSFRWIDENGGAGSVADAKTGTWALVGSSVVLTGRQWHGYASTYWVDGRSPSGFLLFGGVEDCMDPDSYMCLYWSPLAPEQ